MVMVIGEKVPSVMVKQVTLAGTTEIDFAQYVAQGTSVLFGVPAAFSPTCHNSHLPGYVAAKEQFAQKGVDRIACLSANDYFVMSAWGEQVGALGEIDLIADGNAQLAIAMKSDMDARGAGLGTRFVRCAYIVRDGEIAWVHEENEVGSDTHTGAENLLAALDEISA